MPNFNLTQNWVGYLQRSYAEVKQSLLNRVVQVAPEITDHSESNILIIIISMFSGIAEMLNLYIDRMAQEAFLGTCRRYSSAVKLVRLIDYRIKANIPSSVDELFTVVDATTNLPSPTTAPIAVPAGTLITTLNNIPFYTTIPYVIAIGQSLAIIPAIQQEQTVAANLGNTDGTPNQQLPLPSSYVDGTLTLVINGITWTMVDSLGLALSTDKVFIVEIDENQTAQLTFGDGVNGAIPPTGFTVYGDYGVSYGAAGNVPSNSINQLQTTITAPAGLKVIANNTSGSSNGSDFESLEDIRNLAPRSLRTLRRAVTYQDYIDIALLAPGVGTATVRYCCGGPVRVFIGPKTKGIATTTLLNNTQAFFQCKRMLGRDVTVLPAGITRIWVKLAVQAKYGVPTATAYNDTVIALDGKYGYDASDINGSVRESDINALIDNLDSVDYLNLTEIWAEPYARPTNSQVQLNWDRVILPGSVAKHNWSLIYRATGAKFEIYYDGVLKSSTITVGTPYTDPNLNITFTINSSVYLDGYRWDFVTYPSGKDIVIDDNTIPIIDIDFTLIPPSGFFNLTVDQSIIQNKCNPPC